LSRTPEHLSLLPPDEAESEFLKCCGSRRWAREMTEARPFKSLDELLSKADLVCSSLREEDWLEAFHAHPKIGEQKAAAAQSEQARNWAQREQSGMESAAAATRAALAAGNQEYEKRFGFIFIVYSGRFFISIFLQQDFHIRPHAPERKFLVNGNLWRSPAEQPFCGSHGEVDTAMRTRAAKIIMPECSMK